MPALSRTRTILATAAVAIGVAGGAAFATAATGDSSSTATEPAATAPADSSTTPAPPAAPADGALAPGGNAPPAGMSDPAAMPNGPGEELLTGDTADKVTAAALAAEPGATVIRVETDSGGAAYEAHLKLADGSYVTVLFDESFAVTGTEDGFGPGPKGGPMGGQPGTPPSADQGAQPDAGAAPAPTATA